MRKQSGFTILEIIIVFVLLAGIMAFVGPKIWDQFGRAKVKENEIRMLHLVDAIKTYQMDNKSYPPRLEALTQPPGGQVPYAKPDDLKDAWGNDFRYNVPGASQPFEIISLGADGKEGGEGADKDIKKP